MKTHALKKIEIRKEIAEGENIPKYYGVAWREINRLSTVTYPIPLNIIFAHIRKAYLWFQQGDWYKTGYDKGYIKGKAEGRKYALNQLKTQIIRQEAERLIRKGAEAMTDMIKMRDEEKATGYFWKIIDEEVKSINNSI